MLALLDIVLPVFLIIGAGYTCVRTGLFNEQLVDHLMRYATNFALPCLLFTAISTLDLEAVFRVNLLLSFYIGSISCFVIAIFGARFLFGRRPGEAVSIGFAAFFGNTLLLGLPIMERAYGPGSLEPNYAIISIHAPFCFIVGITTMEFARADGRGLSSTLTSVAKAVFSNALMIGLALGFAVNLSGFTLPGPAASALEMIVRSALPIALFSLGGVLVRYGLNQKLTEVAWLCFVKLLVHPAIALFLATFVFDLSQNFTRAVVVTAAMAPGINAYIFANMYNRSKGTVASSILLGTAISILSASIWLTILGT